MSMPPIMIKVMGSSEQLRYRVVIGESDLLLLDGQCSEGMQAHVNFAKLRAEIQYAHGCAPEVARFVVQVLAEASSEGLLICRHADIRSCHVCGAEAGYALAHRTTRFVRKGRQDTSKPLTMGARELASRSISFEGSATLGCCMSCFAQAQPILAMLLADVRAEMPQELTGVPPRYKRYRNRVCRACGWAGHEGQMRRLPTLFGEGTYPAICPGCAAENPVFGRNVVDAVDGFSVELAR